MSDVAYVTELPKTADIVVVGGGVVGAATAFYATQVGLRVLLLERRPALATLTTAASTGAFRLQFDNLEELRLVSESVSVFLDFQEVTRQRSYDPNIRQQGYLWATTSEDRAGAQRSLVEQQRRWGLSDVEVLDGDDARKRWPYLSPDVVQVRFRQGDGFLDPKQLTLGFAAGARCDVAVDCEVTGFRITGGRLTGVRTARGDIASEVAVVAAGPLSGVVGHAVGLELPIAAVARHKVVMPQVAAVPPGAPMTIDDDTGAHWRPALAGAYLLYTDPETPPSEPVDAVPPDPSLAFRLLAPSTPVSVARIAPFWRDVWDHGATHWLIQSGQYTMTPDHRPLLGETDVRGVFVNTGYSGHGIMASAAGSRHLVDVLTGAVPAASNPFRLDRSFERRPFDVL